VTGSVSLSDFPQLKEEKIMVRFYDPKDKTDLARVEKLLQAGAIEYFLVPDTTGAWPVEIRVAEEDLPQAEALLQQALSEIKIGFA
jgi:hypothetical protein